MGIITAILGVLNVIQWVEQLVAARDRGGTVRELEMIKVASMQIVQMCNDAEQKKQTAQPDAMARFISDAAAAATIINNQVSITNGSLVMNPPKPRTGFFGGVHRFARFFFPLMKP